MGVGLVGDAGVRVGVTCGGEKSTIAAVMLETKSAPMTIIANSFDLVVAKSYSPPHHLSNLPILLCSLRP